MAVLPEAGVSVVVSNLKTRAVLAGKLEPETETLVPAGPVAGDRASRVAPWVTVKATLPRISVSGPAGACHIV